MKEQVEPNPNLDPIAFGFMFDERFRRVVARDYEELGQLAPDLSPKSVLVLSGSIIEGLLSDAILAWGKLQFDEVVKMDLGPIIANACEFGILEKKDLPTVVREYRNLVHPGLEIRERIEFDKVDANIAKSAVEVIIRGLNKWSRFYRILSSLGGQEMEFLNLFSAPKIQGSEFDHPWLKSEVHLSTRRLEELDIIVVGSEIETKNGPAKTVSISHEAVRYVELIVLKRTVTRTNFTMSYRNMAPTLAAGSGA